MAAAFMTCILRVNYQSPKWQKTVSGVLSSCSGVRSFRMDEYGRVEVSGTVDPHLLLKKLRKAGKGTAQLCWFQFGPCPSNLFISDEDSHCGRDTRYFPFRYGGHLLCPYRYDHRHSLCYLPPPRCQHPCCFM